MRILHVIESLEFGGAEKVVVDLANAMADDHQIAICCVKRPGELANSWDHYADGWRVLDMEGNELGLPLRIRKVIRQHQAELVHLHNWGPFLETGIAALLCPQVRIVQTVHGPYADYPQGWKPWLKKTLRHGFELLLARRFYKLIAVADSVQSDLLARHLPANRLTTVHNGITTDSPEAAVDLPAPPADLQLVTIARLAPIKNQPLMLEAFKQVHSQYPNSSLWIIGDGPSRSSLTELATELGIQEQIVFAGFREDATALLAHADLFLLSSDYEGISISLLEAMRAQLPVVATNVGGIAETVVDGDTGLLVAKGDAAGFAAAISKLCDQAELRKSMGEAGCVRQQQQFSVASMCNHYLRLYQQP